MSCHHFDDLKPVKRSSNKGCEECLKIGSYWVRLRECLVCGNVACCDASPNKHATKHFKTTKHPVLRSIEPGESWGWCYIDDVMVESVE